MSMSFRKPSIKQNRSHDLTNILITDKALNEFRAKRRKHVKNDLTIILTSKSFEFLMCKCSPFVEIRFTTSSGAGNHVTVYNTFIRSNVNSSTFYD